MSEALPFPRRLTFRGQVEASAFGFSRALFEGAAGRERVLSLWQNGARLEEFEWGHVLWLARPVRVRVETAPALPLVSFGKGVSSAPLDPKTAPFEGVWIVENGRWRELRDGAPVDVSRWLDAGSWSVEPAQSLGEVAALERVLWPVQLDLREQTGIGAPDPKWQTLWESGSKPRAASSRGFERLARMLTPRRAAGAVPLVSNARIVWSSACVLSGTGLFCLVAFLSPPRVRALPLAFVVGGFALVFAVWLGGHLPRRAPRPRVSRATGPAVVLPAMVQGAAACLVTLGLARIALWNLDGLLKMLLISLVWWASWRVLGLSGRLVGSRAVGVGAVDAPLQRARRPGWIARWFQARAVQRAPETGSAARGAQWLGRWLSGRAAKRASGAQDKTPRAKTRDNAGDALRRMLAQMAFQSGLFKTLGRSQARFLMRSMELFERGDLEAALRHAIPLGGKSEGDWSAPPALGLPGLRDELSISPFQMAARGSLNFGPDIEEKLRAMYRRAFEKLRDIGDFDKAAFVLAELLNNSEEAVAFLEEHGRLELAAQIAEARELPPGLVVRQWWLAGARERAVQLAQLRGAFADAVTRMERDPRQRADAVALRLLWGHHLAASGRFGAAVEAVRPAEEGRAFARRWLRLGLEESPLNAKLLCRALQLEPECWSEWQPRLHELWASKDEDAPANRARFARELVKTGADGAAKATLEVAARATMRAHIGDAAAGRERLDKSDWERLQTLSNDAILRADVRLPTVLDARKPEMPVEIRIDSGKGTLAPHDAVRLESGELLVALGEAGAVLLSRDGRTKARFDVPAHHIVRPFDGTRALLLAPRDESLRVSKLDLSQRKATAWGDLRLSGLAREFDGALWFVGSQGRVRALDVSARAPVSLWDSGELNGEARDISVSPEAFAALVERPQDQKQVCESWRFELPLLVLRQRLTPTAFPATGPNTSRRQVFSDGEQFALNKGPMPASPPVEDGKTCLFWQRDGQEIEIEAEPLRLFGAHVGQKGAMVCWQDGEGCVATLVARSIQVQARLRFPGAKTLAARECGGLWLAWDDLGRVALFNPLSGRLEREWTLN